MKAPEELPATPADRRADDPRIPHDEWEPLATRSPFHNLRALVEATDGELDRREYIQLACREIPGASASMAERALDRLLGEPDRSLPTPDADVQALADDISQALGARGVPSDHVAVRPERRARVVTIQVTSRATPGDLNAIWERVGDGDGVDYQPEANRWRIDIDAFEGGGAP